MYILILTYISITITETLTAIVNANCLMYRQSCMISPQTLLTLSLLFSSSAVFSSWLVSSSLALREPIADCKCEERMGGREGGRERKGKRERERQRQKQRQKHKQRHKIRERFYSKALYIHVYTCILIIYLWCGLGACKTFIQLFHSSTETERNAFSWTLCQELYIRIIWTAQSVYVCVCVWERERECVCVRERESVCVCGGEGSLWEEGCLCLLLGSLSGHGGQLTSHLLQLSALVGKTYM